MYGGAVARPIAGAIFFFGLFLKNLGLDLKFPLFIYSLEIINSGKYYSSKYFKLIKFYS